MHKKPYQHGGTLSVPLVQTQDQRSAIRAVVFNDTSVDHHFGCDIVKSAIYQLARLNDIEITTWVPARENWLENEAIVRSAKEADVLIVNGEGTIHHNSAAGDLLLGVGSFGARNNVPSALINMTWHNNGRKQVDALKKFDLVATREEQSATQLRNERSDIFVAPDLSMAFDWNSIPGSRDGIGVTDSVVPDQWFKLETLRGEQQASAIELLKAQIGVRAKLSAIRWRANGLPSLSPKHLMMLVNSVSRLGQNSALNLDEFIRQLSSFELLITGRFHALAMAISTKTPFIAIESNTPKMQSLVLDLGLEKNRVKQVSEITTVTIRQLRSWSPQEKVAITRYLHDGRKNMNNLFSAIRQLAK